MNKELTPDLEEILDDEKIREWFQSRDPNRKKVNPFLDEEAAELYSGKASSLTPSEEKAKDKLYGISYSEHERHIRNVAKNFVYIGIAIGLTIAIILAIIY